MELKTSTYKKKKNKRKTDEDESDNALNRTIINWAFPNFQHKDIFLFSDLVYVVNLGLSLQ